LNTTPGWQLKIDHRLRALWARVPKTDRAGQRINVLLKFSQFDELPKELRTQVHTEAGGIASASIVLADLPQFADSAAVLFMELAQPLSSDK